MYSEATEGCKINPTGVAGMISESYFSHNAFGNEARTYLFTVISNLHREVTERELSEGKAKFVILFM